MIQFLGTLFFIMVIEVNVSKGYNETNEGSEDSAINRIQTKSTLPSSLNSLTNTYSTLTYKSSTTSSSMNTISTSGERPNLN